VKMGAKFTGESCKCTLRQSKSPVFLGNWGDADGMTGGYSVVLACVLRATAEKKID